MFITADGEMHEEQRHWEAVGKLEKIASKMKAQALEVVVCNFVEPYTQILWDCAFRRLTEIQPSNKQSPPHQNMWEIYKDDPQVIPQAIFHTGRL